MVSIWHVISGIYLFHNQTKTVRNFKRCYENRFIRRCNLIILHIFSKLLLFQIFTQFCVLSRFYTST